MVAEGQGRQAQTRVLTFMLGFFRYINKLEFIPY